MTEIKDFRLINEIEKKIIIDSLSSFSTKLSNITSIIEYSFYISLNPSKKEYPRVFLISKEIQEVINKFNLKSKVTSAGLYCGFIKKGKFYISLEGTEYFYNSGAFSNGNQIIVNEKGEKSILYGNNILKEMVLQIPNTLKKNDFLLVMNQNKELIAISTARCDNLTFNELKPKELIAMNLVDKGHYLRDKQ